jgi:hypothetical protein
MMNPMQVGVRVLAIASIVMGMIWVLQGINVLPGSFMTGRIQWAYRGGIIATLGAGLLLFSRRIRR